MKTTVLIILTIITALTAPIGWAVVQVITNGGGSPPMVAMRSELDALTQKNRDLTIDLNALTQRVTLMENGGGGGIEQTYAEPDPVVSNSLADSYAQVVLIADRKEVNAGLSNSGSAYLTKLFGLPRPDLGQNCQPMTNTLLKDMVKTESVGPVRVTMLEPAILSLRQVFRNVKIFEPDLYSRISTAGSLCVRAIRGRPGTVSTHAYGLSVDLNIDGVLDTLGDSKTQLGLILLADFFNKEGWYWGAGFSREDSMHFQVSKEKIEQWLRQGLIRSQ